MINCVIIDDDQMILEGFSKKIQNRYTDKVNVVGLASSIEDAINIINRQLPDLIFLDIEMPGGVGFDILKHIDCRPAVILISASEDHGIRALNSGILHYILKPVDNAELDQAISKVEQVLRSRQESPNDRIDTTISSRDSSISLSTSEGYLRIKPSEVIYCSSQGNYSTFHLSDGRKASFSKSSKYAEEKLYHSQFLRISQSDIVNKDFVDLLDREGYIHMTDETILRVSVRHKANVKKELFANA